MEIQHNFSLKGFNTFGLSVSCKALVTLKSCDEIRDYLRLHYMPEEHMLVLGGGSNLLFTRDFDGVVLKINIPGVHVVRENAEYYWIKAGAGVLWNDLVESCIRADMGGIENLSLIPGTVGAAPVQNIGAYGVELSEVLEAVEAIEIQTGKKHYFRNHECHFGYRDSIFKNEYQHKFIITNVALRLNKSHIPKITYGQLRELLEKKGLREPSIREVSDAVIEIRKAKLPDPDVMGNAGSFFKNPIVNSEKYLLLKKQHENLSGFLLEDGKAKISAAWLIDQCGLKGTSIGGAAVHENQPLVIVNKHNATGSDILELADLIIRSVSEKFGIKLEPEVRIL